MVNVCNDCDVSNLFVFHKVLLFLVIPSYAHHFSTIAHQFQAKRKNSAQKYGQNWKIFNQILNYDKTILIALQKPAYFLLQSVKLDLTHKTKFAKLMVMKTDIKIKKKLGLNKTFVQTLHLNNDDFKFIEKFERKEIVEPLKHIDNYIFENCKSQYKYSGLFQSLYCFLSKFEYDGSDDFKSCLNDLKNAVLQSDMKALGKKLKQIRKSHRPSTCVSNIDDSEFDALQNCLCNKTLLDKLQKVLNNKNNLNQINIPNFFIASDMVADIILLWVFARKDLSHINIKKYLESENRNSFVVEYIKKKLKINDDLTISKKLFVDFLQQQFLTNGFVFHGTNSSFLKNILKNGIDCNAIKLQTKDLIAADEIMQKYGLKNVFCGKISELCQIKYFLSSKTQTSTFYAYQSPEYLSRFCANGWHMNPIDYDAFAYYRKDYKACINNFEILFQKNNFTSEDRKIILKIFSKLWNENVCRNLSPVMIFIPRSAVGCEQESVDELVANCDNLTYPQIFEEFINKRVSFIIRYSKIHPTNLRVVYLPNLFKMFSLSSNCKRDITFTVDGKKVAADGYIPLFTQIEEEKPFLIKFASRTQKGDEFVCLSQNDACKITFDGRPIGMVIAEEGRAFNEKFKNFQKSMQNLYSINQICKKNYTDAARCIKKSKSLAEKNVQKACFYYMKAVKYISNAKAMTSLNKYKCDIDYGTFWEIENKVVDDHGWSIDLIRNGIFSESNSVETCQLKPELLNKLSRLESFLN